METLDRTEYINTRTHCMDLKNEDKIVQSLDISGTIIDVSPAWLKATGYKRSEVLGRHFMEFLDTKSLLRVQKNFPNLKDYGYVDHVNLNIQCKDHHIISVTLNGTSKYKDNGEFERTFCEITPVN